MKESTSLRFDDPSLATPVVAQWKCCNSISETARKTRLPRQRVRQILLNAGLIKPTIPKRRCDHCSRWFWPEHSGKKCCSTKCGVSRPHPRKSSQRFETIGAITRIHLPSGHIALIDTEDLPKVASYNWYISRNSTTRYVRTSSATGRHTTAPLNSCIPALPHRSPQEQRPRQSQKKPASGESSQ